MDKRDRIVRRIARDRGASVWVMVNPSQTVDFEIGYSRSTTYCTDPARIVQAPIFHVNGDDPEAVLFVTELALDYRQKFHKDVVVDIVCFRKLGHNEQDEPFITQPLMYKKIAQHPGTRRVYADRLVTQGVIKADAWSPYLAEDKGKVADWTYPWVCGNCAKPKYEYGR